MLIVGGKEMETGSVAVRSRKEGDRGAVAVEQFLSDIMMEIAEKRR
jgi:threonyl-tRNA synthetase